MQKRAVIEMKFNRSRKNLLVVFVLSLVNVMLTLANAGISFLFSATVPVFAVGLGQAFSEEFGNDIFLIIGVVVAFMAIAFYGMCYLLSKKYKAFIVAALVFFCVDTLFLLWVLTFGADVSVILDIAFHALIIYYLAVGVKAWVDLGKLPYDEVVVQNFVDVSPPQSIALRPQSTKGRILLTQSYNDIEIVVRRTFGNTELVVNGMVYAERKGIVETGYLLEAFVENTSIRATMESTGIMCLYINGSLVSKKRRFF